MIDRRKQTRERIVVGVDLLPLRPGGENGGIKPAIFALLRAAADQGGDKITFVFLTNSASHTQVRELTRPKDILICVFDNADDPFSPPGSDAALEFKLTPPPRDFLRIIEVDILYCPFGASTFHVSGIPTIALIADLLHKDYPYSLTGQEIVERENYIQNTIDVATKIQCISRSGVERVMEHYRVPRSELFYTHLPIHTRLRISSAETIDRARSTSPRPFFFYPANLWLHKNHEILLLAFARYRHQAADKAWDLVLTFAEDNRAGQLRNLAQSLGVLEHVHFKGFVPESDLHRIWQNASALVFPSLHEGFGIPLLEAMHYGVPIISGNSFSLKEVAGDACYLIDPRKPISLGKAMLEVTLNSQLRSDLAKRGYDRLKLFDLDVAARSLIEEFYAVARGEHGFPRKPSYAHQPPILTVPTPASRDPYQIELQVDPVASAHTFWVHLDDLPFGSFAPTARSFSFVCRPEGRMLNLRVAEDDNTETTGIPNGIDVPVRSISATDARGRRILLYDNPKPLL